MIVSKAIDEIPTNFKLVKTTDSYMSFLNGEDEIRLFWHENYNLWKKIFYRKNVLHRSLLDGPAYESWYYDGTPCSSEYYVSGIEVPLHKVKEQRIKEYIKVNQLEPVYFESFPISKRAVVPETTLSKYLESGAAAIRRRHHWPMYKKEYCVQERVEGALDDKVYLKWYFIDEDL